MLYEVITRRRRTGIRAFAAERAGRRREVGDRVTAITALQQPGWASRYAIVATRTGVDEHRLRHA